MSMTIREFLLARIAEDEVDALALEKELGRWHRERAAGGADGSQGSILATLIVPGSPYHPDRVLAECEAKRRIVGLHGGEHVCWQPDYPVRGDVGETMRWGDCATMCYLAAAYADHPDYRGEVGRNEVRMPRHQHGPGCNPATGVCEEE